MAETNPKVMKMIESELKKNPGMSNRELLEKARSIDEGVDNLSARQFNAMYPLQVKRSMAPRKRKAKHRTGGGASGGKRGGTRKARSTAGKAAASRSGDGRDQVRKVLLELARDVANAEGKGDVVGVVMDIDRYVDRVVKAAG